MGASEASERSERSERGRTKGLGGGISGKENT